MNANGPILLAFSAGMVATVNPCGFALLPAYLTFFLGLEDPTTATVSPTPAETPPQEKSPILRALAVSAAVTSGFVVVFGLIGVIWSSLASAIAQYLPLVTSAIGVGVVILGIAMLRGYQPSFGVPKLQVTSHNRQVFTMFLYGVSYAVASLSCTMPIFATTVVTTFRNESFFEGLSVFLAYGLGMGVVLAILTLSLAMARGGLLRRLRLLMQHMDKIAGGFLLIAGIYVIYYGWYEWQVSHNTDSFAGGGLAQRVESVRSSINGWINNVGPLNIGVLCVGFILLALVGAWTRKAWRESMLQSAPTSDEKEMV